MAQTAIRQTVLYGLALVATKGIGLAMIPIMTRGLDPAAYGTLEVLLTLADVGGILVGFGLADTLFRFAASGSPDERREAAAEITGHALLMAALLGGLGMLAAPWVASQIPVPVSSLQVTLLVTALACTACIQVPLAWLRMNDNAPAFLAFTVSRVLIQAIIIVVLLTSGYGVLGVLVATAVADVIIAAALLIAQARDSGIRLRPSRAGRLLTYGGPLVVGGMASFVLGSLDRWLLAGRVDVAEIALYGLAVKFAAITALLMYPFDMWWYPRRLTVLASEEGKARSAEIVTIGLVLVLTAGTGVAQIAPFAIRLLTPPAYHPAGNLIPWLVAAGMLHVASNLGNVGCFKGRTTVLPTGINILAAGVTLVLYLLLIPTQGIQGAIAATIAGMATRFIVFHAVSQRLVYLPLPYGRLLALAALAALGIAAPAPAGVAVAAALPLIAWRMGMLPLEAILRDYFAWAWMRRRQAAN